MKKLMILALVIGTASVASATLTLVAEVEGTPYDLSGSGEALAVGTTVDVLVVQDVPNLIGSGGEITIMMAASGGSATDTTPTCDWPLLSGELSYCCWEWSFNAGVNFIDNGDGMWSAWMGKTAVPSFGTPGLGCICGGMPGSVYVSTMAFSFIVTETTDLVFDGTWDGVSYDGVVRGTVNVVSCACWGDTDGNGYISINDMAQIVNFLSPAYADTSPPYTCPTVPFGKECWDVDGSGTISITDMSTIIEFLSPAYAEGWLPYTTPPGVCMPSPYP